MAMIFFRIEIAKAYHKNRNW